MTDWSLPPCGTRGLTLGNPSRPGAHLCLHCGHRWNHRRDSVLVDGHPRQCPVCHSPSWWLAPTRANSRTPETTNWDNEVEKMRARTRKDREKRMEKSLRKRILKAALLAESVGMRLLEQKASEDPLEFIPLRVIRRPESAPPLIPPVGSIPMPPSLEDWQ